MTVLAPDRLDIALSALADDPGLTVLAGGTDLMVEVNYGHRRPDGVLSLRRLAELRHWQSSHRATTAGRGRARRGDDLQHAPRPRARRAAARPRPGRPHRRQPADPQHRHDRREPGDRLARRRHAAGARGPRRTVELAGATGRRTVPVADFLPGPKRTDLAPGELIAAVRVPVVPGPAEFLKIGVRNAMVIAVANCALVADTTRRGRAVRIRVGRTGSRARRGGRGVGRRADRLGRRHGLRPRVAAEFGARMAAAAARSTTTAPRPSYRRHAVGVLAAGPSSGRSPAPPTAHSRPRAPDPTGTAAA